jgi:putative chitinase
MLIRQIIEAYPFQATRPPQPPQTRPEPKPQINLEPVANIPLAQPLIQRAAQAGIKGIELAQFLAQVKHESWNFTRLQEVPQGTNYFRRYDPKHSPKQARSLGNKHHGDGQRYRGRGYIQLTGRENYQRAGRALNIDLVNKPERAAEPQTAAAIAIWYWTNRVKPYVQDFMDTARVTKFINPQLKGLADRERNFRSLLA